MTCASDGRRHQHYSRTSNRIKAIELWPCGYQAPCKVRNCQAEATTIARAIDSGGRPVRQYELCAIHAEQVGEREQGRGREIVRRGVGR